MTAAAAAPASPAMGVAYFLWRRTRWTIAALGVNLLVVALLARILPAEASPAFLIAPSLLLLVWGAQLLGALTFGPTDFGARASGFPVQMLGLPARTIQLVFWPMLYSALMVTLGLVALHIAVHPDYQLLIAATFCVALFAWFQVVAWFPFPIAVMRGIVAVSAAFGLAVVGGVLWMVGFSSLVIAGSYSLLTLTAFVLALYGVSLTRRGDGQESFVLVQLARILPAPRVAGRPFPSAASAQLWYDCRRNAMLLPTAMFLFSILIVYGILQPDHPGIILGGREITSHVIAIGMLLILPVVGAKMLAGGLGKFDFWSNKAPTFTAFFATRPMPTVEFVAVKLRAALRSTLLTWLIVLTALAIGLILAKCLRPHEPAFAGVSFDSGWTWLGAAGLIPFLIFLTWRSYAVGLFAPLCGRPWVNHSLSFLGFVPILAIGPIWYWLKLHPQYQKHVISIIPWLILVAAAIKVILFVSVCNTLGRTGLLSSQAADLVARGWVILGIVLMIAAWILSGLEPLAGPIALLLLPGVRVGLAPLALRWNRHRSGRSFRDIAFELCSPRRYLHEPGVHATVPVVDSGRVITLKTVLIIVMALVLLGAVAGGGVWYRSHSTAGADKDAKIVRVEPVQRGELVELVQAPGEVQPRNKVSISAKISSRIIEIPLKEGDRVKRGDLLIKLDSSDLAAALRSAQARYAAQQASREVAQSRVAAQRAQIDGLKANLTEARLDLERQKGLLTSHDVSQSIVDTAERRVQEQAASLLSADHNLKAEETNLLVLKHNLEAADAEIARANEDLSYTVIESPIDGVVTVINAKVGELVMTGTMNNAGTVIMEVADLAQMLVYARVDETDVANVEVGQHARVHVQAYPGRVFNGTITAVALARSVERNNNTMGGDAKTFKVEILLDTQGQRIYSGLTADVEIEAHRHTDVVKVPSQSVLGRSTDDLPQAMRDSDPNVDKSKTLTTVVYRYIDGKAVVTPVKVGPSDINDTLIESGLSENDRVITGPYKILESLANDQKVKEETKATTQPTTAPAAQSVAKL